LDPDEFLLKHGAAAFNATLSQAMDALTYAWKQLNSRFIQRANDLTGQQKAVDEYLALLAGAKQSGHVDPIRWGAALHRVSRLTGMPPEQLHRKLKNRPAQTRQTAQVASVPKPKIEILTAQDRAEAFILGYLLCEPGKWAQVQAELQPADFTDGRRKALAEIYWQHQQDEGEPVFNQFLSLLEGVNVGEQSIKELAVKLAQEAQAYSDPVNSLKSCLEYFHDQRMRLAQEDRQAQLRRSGDRTANGPDVLIDEAAVLQQISDFSRTPDPRRLPVRYGA
jgi:DNA primase